MTSAAGDQRDTDAQRSCAAADLAESHTWRDHQSAGALGSDFLAGQARLGAQNTDASEETSAADDHGQVDAHARFASAADLAESPVRDDAQTIIALGSDFLAGHLRRGAQAHSASEEQTPAKMIPVSSGFALETVELPDQVLVDAHLCRVGEFHYGLIARLCDVYDDLERVVIANQNRVDSLKRMGLGEELETNRLRAVVEALQVQRHAVELDIRRAMRKHPLGPWIKATRGIGLHQGARLLAATGDPFIRPDILNRDGTVKEPSRPRRGPAELWAYCGYKPGQRRAKGQKANWSDTAKMRSYLVAESCMKAGGPFREVYDRRKAHTEDHVHEEVCVRCGPAGKPAQPGSPWSAAHRHADALRVTAKEILKALFNESKKLQA